MSNETNAPNALIALTTGGGVIATVNEHATIISISIALAGLLIGLFFHVMTVLHRRKLERKNDQELIEQGRREAYEEMLKVDKTSKMQCQIKQVLS